MATIYQHRKIAKTVSSCDSAKFLGKGKTVMDQDQNCAVVFIKTSVNMLTSPFTVTISHNLNCYISRGKEYIPTSDKKTRGGKNEAG